MSSNIGNDGCLEMAATANNHNDKYQEEEIINWVEEANSIINDVKAHVADIYISRKLPNNNSSIYLNLRTFEDATYCVHVSKAGFCIVSNSLDTIDDNKRELMDDDKEEVFETPYALLDKISPSYVESFGNQLCKQLLDLKQMRTELNDEDEEDSIN